MTEEQILNYVDRLYYFYESPDCYTSDNEISNFIDKPMSSIMNIGIAYIICYKTIRKFNTPFKLSPKQIDEGYTIKDLCNNVIEYDLKKDHTLPTKKCFCCGVKILESIEDDYCNNCKYISGSTTIQCNIRRLKDIVKLIDYGKKRETLLKDFEEIEYIAQSDRELELLMIMGLKSSIKKQCDYCDLSCSVKDIFDRPCRYKELNGKYTIFKHKNFNKVEYISFKNEEIKQKNIPEEFEVETLKVIDTDTGYVQRIQNAKVNIITSWDSQEGQMFIKHFEDAKYRRIFQNFSKNKLFTGLCYYINNKIKGNYNSSNNSINLQSELKEIVSEIDFWEELLNFLTEKYELDLTLTEEQFITGYTLENLCSDILIITKIRKDSNSGIDNFIKNN